MKLLLFREHNNGEETLGKLFFKNSLGETKYLCTCEDEHRNKTVYGESRVPAGVYPVALARNGRIYEKYLQHRDFKISEFTRNYGVLEISTKGFNVQIHVGGRGEDTAGAILLGVTANNNSWNIGVVNNSVDAYKYFITEIEQASKQNDDIFIYIIDGYKMISWFLF